MTQAVIWNPSSSTRPEEGSDIWFVNERGAQTVDQYIHGAFWRWSVAKYVIIDYVPSMWRYRQCEDASD